MPQMIKHKDWKGWLDGLRSKAFRAGAESVATNLTALITTNGIANAGIPGLNDIGMNWKTAIVATIVQFCLRVALAAALYIQEKPDPDVIIEEIDTQLLKKRGEIVEAQKDIIGLNKQKIDVMKEEQKKDKTHE